MFLTIDELKSVLYEYQMNNIADGDNTILEDAIDAAVEEVRAYLLAANQRRETAQLSAQQYATWQLYDVEATFNATGNNRNKFLLRLTKRIAAWNVVELAAPDILYERVQERYNAAIATLEKVAGTGEYANARLIIYGLPSLTQNEQQTTQQPKPFHMVSRPKFNHE